jgi:predicted acylesterase/phospholipase RssA
MSSHPVGPHPLSGVLKVLQQLGVVDENTRVAGISSGAITAGAMCSGMDEAFLHKTVRRCTAWREACGGPMTVAPRFSAAAGLARTASLWLLVSRALTGLASALNVVVGQPLCPILHTRPLRTVPLAGSSR